MNWLDLGIFVVILVFVIISVKKGLMTSVLSHFSVGMNAVLSFFLCKPIQSLLNVCHLGGAISNHYYTSLIDKSSNFATNLLSFDSQEALHAFVGETIKEGHFNGITKTMFKWFLNNKSLYSTLQSSGVSSRNLAEIISSAFSNFFTIIIAFIISFILIYFIVFLFKLLVNKLRTIGFVKFVDNFLGIFYGLFRVLIIFIIICAVIKLMSPFSFMDSVVNYINGSFFGKLIFSQISDFIDNYLSFSEIIRSVFK